MATQLFTQILENAKNMVIEKYNWENIAKEYVKLLINSLINFSLMIKKIYYNFQKKDFHKIKMKIIKKICNYHNKFIVNLYFYY